MTERISLTYDGGVARLHMQDRSGGNAFSRAFVDDLVAALLAVGNDERANVCVIEGLPEVFSAGGDRSLLLELANGTVAPYDLLLTRTLLEVPIPTIAAMAGPAVGGGFIFGIACDIVVLASTHRYGCNFMELGFTPGMGTTRLLQRAVGEYVAAEMMYGCQYMRGRDIGDRGLINHVVAPEKVERKAMSVARRIADKPRAALRLLKRSLSLARRQAFTEALTIESMMHEICFAAPETRRRIAENYREAGDSSHSSKPEPGAREDTC